MSEVEERYPEEVSPAEVEVEEVALPLPRLVFTDFVHGHSDALWEELEELQTALNTMLDGALMLKAEMATGRLSVEGVHLVTSTAAWVEDYLKVYQEERQSKAEKEDAEAQKRLEAQGRIKAQLAAQDREAESLRAKEELFRDINR